MPSKPIAVPTPIETNLLLIMLSKPDFGIDAIEAHNVTELVDGIKKALKLDKPVSIVVKLDGSEYLRMPSAV